MCKSKPTRTPYPAVAAGVGRAGDPAAAAGGIIQETLTRVPCRSGAKTRRGGLPSSEAGAHEPDIHAKPMTKTDNGAPPRRVVNMRPRRCCLRKSLGDLRSDSTCLCCFFAAPLNQVSHGFPARRHMLPKTEAWHPVREPSRAGQPRTARKPRRGTGTRKAKKDNFLRQDSANQ